MACTMVPGNSQEWQEKELLRPYSPGPGLTPHRLLFCGILITAFRNPTVKTSPSSWNGCGYYTVDITVQSDNYGCPWLAATHSTAEDLVSGETYSAPDTRSSVCPKIPVDTFDISWDANVSKQKTTLMLDATGGTVNRTLHTYLMEGGKLCDGSKFDNRGAYCRFVSSGITLNVLGCDQSSVTTSAVDHPITDVELHDINVAVNTRNIGSGLFTSTCSFQYIIDEI